MIDYVDAACRAWGRCSRWVLTDTDEGYPSADTIEKARQGLLSMRDGGGPRSQHFREVRLGDALIVARAIKAEPLMPLPLTATLWVHYVVKGPARPKLPKLSEYLGSTVSIANYWRNIDRAHHFLAGRIASPPMMRR